MGISLMRDPVWQFAGSLLSAVAIVVAIIIAVRQYRQKRLQWFSRSKALLSVGAEFRDKIQILYEGKAVAEVISSEFGIRCAGGLPLMPDDFVCPVEFFFGEHATILTAEIIRMRPSDLGAKIGWHGGDESFAEMSKILVVPLLLNPGDYIVLRCLVTASSGLTVSGRIAGVREIEFSKKRYIPALKAAIFISTCAAALFTGYQGALDILPWPIQWVVVLGVALGAALIFVKLDRIDRSGFPS